METFNARFMRHFLIIPLVFGIFVIDTQAADQNLQTCLDGRYPALCDKARLTPDQRAQAAAAELRANLSSCLDGRYPALCNHSLLNPEEADRVRQAERIANLNSCESGRYPTLCHKKLLTPAERQRVDAAERAVNLENCMTGRYPALCSKELLTPDQAKAVADAERRAAANVVVPKVPASPSRLARPIQPTTCESGHWIQEVMGDGRIIALEDGSLWEVDAVDQITSALWLPITDLVICPGKIINTDDNETVDARRIR